MRTRMIIYLLLLGCLPVLAKADNKEQRARNERYHAIHLHHVGIGLETGMFRNARLSPRLFYGVGSYRNLFNADVGVKYVYSHPMAPLSDERLAAHYISPFIAANVNFYRWETGCMYIGGEFAYDCIVAADHYLPSSGGVEHDVKIGRHHGTVRAKAGARWDHWELNVHFEYDLEPAMNQKYIYEFDGYDYDRLRPFLFERYRVGLSVSYLIPFL